MAAAASFSRWLGRLFADPLYALRDPDPVLGGLPFVGSRARLDDQEVEILLGVVAPAPLSVWCDTQHQAFTHREDLAFRFNVNARGPEFESRQPGQSA